MKLQARRGGERVNQTALGRPVVNTYQTACVGELAAREGNRADGGGVGEVE
jgi:hypothetical protein